MNKATDTAIDKTISFDITILPKSRLHKWLQEKNWAPKKRSLTMRPLVLGNMKRISRLLLKIDPEMIQGKLFLDATLKLISDHSDTVANVLAISIQNTSRRPSSRLIRLIRENLTAEEILKLLSYVLSQMDLKTFVLSIISIRGLNVLDNAEPKKEDLLK